MPLYEYRCKKCGDVSTFLEKINQNGKHECKKCGSNEMVKIYSSFQTGDKEKSGGTCSTGTCPLG
ncbi:MAG: FmdB family zinc ribbon protein [Candidatus Rifleibacteriota bacterium]